MWEAHAGWWQENFTDGADAEYTEQILPMAADHLAGAVDVLDVGTGEGQLARVASALQAGAGRVVGVDPVEAQVETAGRRAGGPVYARAAAAHVGCRVVGVDPIAAQLETAGRRAGGPLYARSAAASLPFPDGSFDAVVACLVFEHIADVDRALAEVGRVLRPGGRFLFFLNHPLLQVPGSGWIDDHILDEQYWRIGPYLVEDSSLEEVDKDVFVPFVHRPLSRYVNAMADAGLFVQRMEEPAPPPGFLARAPEYQAAASIPRLLFLHAVKAPSGTGGTGGNVGGT